MGMLKSTTSSVQVLRTRPHRLEARCLEIDFLGFRSDWKPRNAPSGKRFTSYGVFHGDRIVATSRVSHTPLVGWGGGALEILEVLGPEVLIVATVVAPAYRGRGLARALRGRLQLDYSRILTGTCEISDPAIFHLNRQQGFRLVFRQRSNDQWFWARTEAAEMAAGR